MQIAKGHTFGKNLPVLPYARGQMNPHAYRITSFKSHKTVTLADRPFMPPTSTAGATGMASFGRDGSQFRGRMISLIVFTDAVPTLEISLYTSNEMQILISGSARGREQL
jgi:hypothetical protein